MNKEYHRSAADKGPRRRPPIKKIAGVVAILILLTIVSAAIFFSTGSKYQLVKKAVKICIQEEQCAVQVSKRAWAYASLKTDSWKCTSFNDSLYRDICLFSKSYEGYSERASSSADHSLCLSLSDPYLSKLCIRTLLRPHMDGFMSHPYLNLTDVGTLHSACNNLSPYMGLECTYIHSAREARHNLSTSRSTCLKLSTQRIQSECLFYAAIGLSFGVESDPASAKNISKLCDEIGNKFWRMECHYLVADEASDLPEDKLDIAQVADSCHRARELSSFSCFDHVTFYLPFSKVDDFCDLPMEEHERKECYRGLGKQLLFQNGFDLNATFKSCAIVPSSYLNQCIRGAVLNFALKSKKPVMEIANACDALSPLKRTICREQMGTRLAINCDQTVAECFSQCQKTLPPFWYQSCAEGLGTITTAFSSYDFQTAARKCRTLPVEWQPSCFVGVGKASGAHSAENMSLPKEICMSLQGQEKLSCSLGMGNSLMRQFSNSIPQAFSACASLKGEYRERCDTGVAQWIAYFYDEGSCKGLPNDLREVCENSARD